MLLTFTDPALHNVSIAVFRILITPKAFTCRVRAAALAAALQEDLHIILGVEESTRSATTFSFAFALALKVALENAAETPNRAAGKPSLVPLGSAALVVNGFCGFGIT